MIFANADVYVLGPNTRQLAREGRLFATVIAVRSKSGTNIVEVSHQRVFTDLPAKPVLLEVVIETRDRSHLEATIASLRAANVDVDVRGNQLPAEAMTRQ